MYDTGEDLHSTHHVGAEMRAARADTKHDERHSKHSCTPLFLDLFLVWKVWAVSVEALDLFVSTLFLAYPPNPVSCFVYSVRSTSDMR
eukprot:7338-Eustigmatos_ZCMA.PRE.1